MTKKVPSPGLNRDAFLGKAAQDLLYLSSEQVAVIYERRGLGIPVEVSSTLLYLARHKNAVLTDISGALDIPHQLAAQRIAKLQKLDLLVKRPDPDDRRRTHLQLTRTGREQARVLDRCMADMATVYKQLYEEIGCDLAKKLNQAIEALKKRDLAARFDENFRGDRS
ncbi:MAG: hypothetical protein CMP07_09965 [Xanthomonadales bacterium]|nr:hypothetical protein [Xanthomonadales bacterium]